MNIVHSHIKSKRLLLRDIVPQDLENVFKGLSDPLVIKYYGISYKTLEETKEQMELYEASKKNQTGKWWAVCSADKNYFYGIGGLYSLNKKHQKAEIGFWLLPEYWGKGIMAEAMREICLYGFKNLNLHRIEGFVETENINCKKAIEKLGFIYEGTMRECEIKNGDFISLDIYAIFNRNMTY